MTKQEFMQRAWLGVYLEPGGTAAKADLAAAEAGEAYDRLFPEEKPADGGWIRFSERNPTEKDCLSIKETAHVCCWFSDAVDSYGYPTHIPLEDTKIAFGRHDCFWRPIPPRPESKP